MKFKKLLQTNSWLSIKAILLELYPNELKNIAGYENVFNKLLLMDAEESNISIVVKNEKDDFDHEEYVDVSGMYLNPKNEDEKFSQAIEFTAWRQWLGMDIHQKSLNHFTELEIISHCLYEMTFVGFEEVEIQEELKTIENQIDDYKNMSEEEKRTNTTSLEDFIIDMDGDCTEDKLNIY